MKLPLKLNNNNNIYYKCNKFYSYPAFFGIIDGGRGIGKTTTFLIKGIQIVNNGGEFIYLRRYKPEVKKWITKDSLSTIIDGVVYKGDGTGGYTMFVEDTTLGYAISLSTARSYKSTDFSKVELIIFDEAIVKQTSSYRYLQDEVTTFLEFVSTVVRTRTNVRVVLLGNNEDMFSPYANFFELPIYDKIYFDKERGIYCEHAINSKGLLELEKQTGLYKLINNTAYGDYHYNNKVLGNIKLPIEKKPIDSKILFRFICNNQTLNIYTYYKDNYESWLYCERKDKVIKDNISYIILENGKTNYLYVDLYKKKLQSFVYRHYYMEHVTYSDEKSGGMLTWLIEEL